MVASFWKGLSQHLRQELDTRDSTLAIHKERSDDGEGDEGEMEWEWG